VAEDASSTARVPLPQARDIAARVGADEDEEIVPARRAPKTTPFGSVWDSQIGTPTAPAAASLGPIGDDEDFDEPEIPEYLIAEQRRGANRGGGGGRGARGGRSAYQSAMDRERYGSGGGGGGGGGGGARGGSRGINRYPDVSGRTRPVGPAREERGYGRQERDAVPPPPRGSSEPWSDVPPELEALLRAQVAQKPAPSRPSRGPDDRSRTESVEPPAEPGTLGGAEVSPTTEPATTRKRATRVPGGRTPRTARAEATPAPEPVASPAVADDGQAAAVAEAAPKRRPGRPRKSAVQTGEGLLAEAGPTGVASTTKAEPKPRAAAKPRTTRKPVAAEASAAVGDPTDAGTTDAAVAAAPKRRTTRKATPAEPA
jgi:hypothetical protein